MFGALSQRRGGAEGPRDRPQPDGRRASPSQEDNLQRGDPASCATCSAVGRPALASLERGAAVASARFARDALPGARSSSSTLDAQIPFIQQARRLVRPQEAGRPRRATCAPTVPVLVRLNRRSPPHARAEPRSLASCQNNVLLPFAKTPIPDPDFPWHTGEPWFEESPRAFVGLSGESRLADANSPMLPRAGRRRRRPRCSPPARRASSCSARTLDFALNGRAAGAARRRRRSSARTSRARRRSRRTCNAAGGRPASRPRPGHSSLPRSARAREGAPEQYRRLESTSTRTCKGCRRSTRSSDPLERMQLKRLGLKRDAEAAREEEP